MHKVTSWKCHCNTYDYRLQITMTTLLFDDLSVECDSSIPSNGSHKNSPSDFYSVLPMRYELGDTDRYEVACCDVIYPMTWYNLEEDAKIVWTLTDNDSIQYKAIVHASHYHNVTELIEAVEQALDDSVPETDATLKGICKLKYDQASNIVKPMRNSSSKFTPYFTQFPASLTTLLGYSPRSSESNLQSDISNGIHSLYIHLDLIEPQIIGNRVERIVQIIHLPDRLVFGKMEHVSFFPRKYFKLDIKEFDKMKVTIKDGKGRIINFRTGSVKLYFHFRRCSSILR